MVTELIGYPPISISIVLGIGFPLALVKPYWAFLFATLVLTSGNADMFNNTRTVILGPYLNLSDACVLVALAAYFVETYNKNKPLQLPRVVFILLIVLTIAALQSFWVLGWTYETARAVRWSVQFPLAFFLGAYLVTTYSRAKQLIGVLLLGSFLAVFQHLFFVWVTGRVIELDNENYHMVRTISFMAGGMPAAFLLTGMIWKIPGKVKVKALRLLAVGLFATSLLFNQTRSVWLAMVAAVPCLLFFFKRRGQMVNIARIGFLALFIGLSVGWISRIVAPDLDSSEMVIKRLIPFLEDDPWEAKTTSRINQFKVEMNSWLEGSLILGRGLFFFQTMDKGDGIWNVAFGHLGYVTYLSQLGFLGLLAYGVYLPLSVVRNANLLWRYGNSPALQYMALLGAASIIYLSIMFLMSSSFLGLGYFAPAVLYGSVWALARSTSERVSKEEILRIRKAPRAHTESRE
ncbi:hypothetical protein JYT87_02905 [Nitrospira defluvii]|nr:hypothetical protein [Nitrospira defluvii]